jgi:hypothetical protein
VGNRKCFSLSSLLTFALLINFTVTFTKKKRRRRRRKEKIPENGRKPLRFMENH